MQSVRRVGAGEGEKGVRYVVTVKERNPRDEYVNYSTINHG